MDFPHLFAPGFIGSCRLKNRIIMALYPTKYATEGKVNERMLEFYRARACGGAGLIVLDGPCLDYPRAYKGQHILRFDAEEYEASLSELLNVVHAGGSQAFMHLAYPKERKTGPEDNSKVSLANNMSTDEADDILGMSIHGARKAREIGYDGVEVQASYGGLIAQLLSPASNRRKDEYGGGFENRTRLLIELIKGIKREVAPDFPVMIKLVCDEFIENGFGMEEAVRTAKLIEAAGADAIVANAGNKKTKYRTIPSSESESAPLVPLAAQLKAVVGIPVIAIGKISEPTSADEILREGKADFIAMARALVADPDLPDKALSGTPDKIRRCLYCLEDCADKGVPGIGRCCTVNPFAGNESIWQMNPAVKPKKILVIGGGPSGIQAALVASQRGHQVELWEQSDQIGGQLKIAHLAPYKSEIAGFLRYQERCLLESRVIIKKGIEATPQKILDQGSETVILATGSNSRPMETPGAAPDQVIDVRQLYENRFELGENIMILGGGDIGCETAEWVYRPGKYITIVDIAADILSNMKKIPKERMLVRLKQKGITILTETSLISIENNEAMLRNVDGTEQRLKTDHVIVSVGSISERSLAKQLEGQIDDVYVVGDAANIGNLGSALRDATKTAVML